MDTVRLRLRVEDDDDLAAAYAASSSTDVAVREVTAEPSGGLEQQIEPVTAVLIGAGVVATAKMIMDWWDRRRGGLVIDLRPDQADMFYRDPDVAYGYVVTIPAEGGTVTVDVKDLPDAAEKWIGDVVSSAFSSAAEAAAAAHAALGAERVQVAAP